MNELLIILDTMDVPQLRKKDLRWLSRNLAIRNRDHPQFPQAMKIIRELLDVINILDFNNSMIH